MHRALSNLQKLIFHAVILFLPTQLGKHFWPDFSYVLGIRVDYLSPTLYFTDVLILLLFITYTLSYFFSKKKHWRFEIGIYLILVLFLLIGIVLSNSPLLGLYGLVKFLEFGFFVYYVATVVKNQQQIQRIMQLFAVGVLFESCLAIAQFVKQGSLNGIFYFFGERFFSGQTPGIANASLNGSLVLRPYGTFSHPNVLAGYLTIVMTMVIYHLSFTIYHFKKYFFIFSLTVGSIALFLTMSRVAMVLWVLSLSISIWRQTLYKNHKSSIINRQSIIGLLVVFVCIGSIISLSPLRFRFFTLGESVSLRFELIQASLLMMKDHLVFGVGLFNFLPNLPDFLKMNMGVSYFGYLQPVHNIFLLVLAETGIIGLGFFMYFLWKTYKRIKDKKFIILSTILILGLFDHYWLTLQQGQLLFAFVLGLCWSASQLSNKR